MGKDKLRKTVQENTKVIKIETSGTMGSSIIREKQYPMGSDITNIAVANNNVNTVY